MLKIDEKNLKELKKVKGNATLGDHYLVQDP